MLCQISCGAGFGKAKYSNIGQLQLNLTQQLYIGHMTYIP